MTPTYTAKLSFKVQKTNIDTQKIDNSIFQIIKIILASFQIED